MSPVVNKFESLLGADQVVSWTSLGDARFEANDDLSILFPESIEQLSALVRTCYDQRWRMLSCGQRTKFHWGNQRQLTNIDVVISTARLNHVVEHWVDDFTMRVEAGLGLVALQNRLQPHNQFWPVDPLYEQQATVGGIVATADGGSLRQRYGSVRDTIIGVQFVRYDGEVVKAGGRVVKNVAGYDLMKLMTGAYGTLGILSQLTLRLYPITAQSQTVVLSGPTEAIAKAALQVRLRGLTARAMDLIGGAQGLQLTGRFEGIAAGVEEQVERFQAIATESGLTYELVDDSLWSTLPQQLGEADQVLCKVGMLPTQLVPLLERLAKLPSGWLARLHNSSGLGLIALPADGTVDMVKSLEMLRSHCNSHKGFLTILQAPQSLPLEPWGYTGNALTMMNAIKQQFDPHGLLNPGRFVGGL
ncbi:fad fmn-dependent dehydrogenase [Leptolyngbya sp. Heron Island J]|uniref:FAD-binding oxidoreductase n=1 Tax=Leptolyngbya sp. Heron Island J TaxID=1385935 RepID=UPI0003B97746|nr:FAD-binding oxidoreductase [Leptolyngbya sp. Heron Island J]ESA35651.1 fad fmn-dependent dehydrogenase [Leptolyngbya sp. Heron Island J]